MGSNKTLIKTDTLVNRAAIGSRKGTNTVLIDNSHFLMGAVTEKSAAPTPYPLALEKPFDLTVLV